MAINISEQFILNVSQPIDSRMVVEDSSIRDSITYKYDGLKIFQKSDRKTYTWNETNEIWETTEISGEGDSNYVTKWSSTYGLTASAIYSTNGSSNTIGKIGINTQTPQAELQVDKSTGSSQPFVINKDNGTTLGNNWFNNGSDNYFSLSSGSGAIKFRNNGEIWILSRSANSTAINSTDGNYTNGVAIFSLTSISLTKDTIFPTNGSSTTYAKIKSSNNFSNKSTPDYTWHGDDTSGIYHPANGRIGLSINGNRRLLISNSGLLLTQNNTNIEQATSLIHLDKGNSTSVFMKFTAGTTTGIGTLDGFNIGINAEGFPLIVSRSENRPILFAYANGSLGGNSFFSMERNSLTMYTDGAEFANLNLEGQGYADSSHRIIYGSKFATGGSSGTNIIGTFSIPNNSQVTIEVTFTSSVKVGDPETRQFRTNKLIKQYTTNNSGSLNGHNTGGISGISLAALTSTSSSSISNGSIDSITNNIIAFRQTFTGSITEWSSIVDYKLTINNTMGHL